MARFIARIELAVGMMKTVCFMLILRLLLFLKSYRMGLWISYTWVLCGVRYEEGIVRRYFMDYLTTSEAAEKWNISRRRVTVLCSTGRIPGALQKGGVWLIPKKAKKPEDGRKVRYIGQKK